MTKKDKQAIIDKFSDQIRSKGSEIKRVWETANYNLYSLKGAKETSDILLKEYEDLQTAQEWCIKELCKVTGNWNDRVDYLVEDHFQPHREGEMLSLKPHNDNDYYQMLEDLSVVSAEFTEINRLIRVILDSKRQLKELNNQNI